MTWEVECILIIWTPFNQDNPMAFCILPALFSCVRKSGRCSSVVVPGNQPNIVGPDGLKKMPANPHCSEGWVARLYVV